MIWYIVFFFTYPWIPFVFFQLKVAQQKSVMAFYILLFFNKIRYINLQLRIICHFTNTHLQYNATPQKCKYYWYAVSNSTCITKSKCDLILFIFFYVEYIGIFSTFLYSICTVALNNWNRTIFDIVWINFKFIVKCGWTIIFYMYW